jgi:phosphohistidine phosphatase sixA
MSKIYFIRHAKAVEENKDSAKDALRELSQKGKDDAKFMASRLKMYDVAPKIIYSSSAKRCEQTAKIIAKILKLKEKYIEIKDELYDISFENLLEFVRKLDKNLDEIFIITHNPSITEICEYLSDSSIDNIPTSGIFCIEFGCEFKNLKEGSAKALFFDHPKKHQK